MYVAGPFDVVNREPDRLKGRGDQESLKKREVALDSLST